ncbi:CS1 type fimbrial major subunit [Yersinia aleksiciae]|uniref:Fimbrial protein n=1 Tax=Yersinia aleksiciae TaxID=263819 RepID=A0ABN4HB29_YERAE|nr:CS1 type fimbrial major subunit [Yersinia aleksiciae]AKP35254.1 fimbrial protein [Yersinia aleksiciae]CFQ38896.1 Colonization factor antigen I subunit B [Yersinia aleksiciae]
MEKLHKFATPLLASLAIVFAFNAQAVQRDITITADVDASIDITNADGTALPGAIKLQYIPGRGLAPSSISTKIWSNSATSSVNISLLNAAQMRNTVTGTAVPLTVSLGADERALTTTATSFTYASLFPSGIVNGSNILPLKFAQATQGILATGTYSGVVSLLITQATTSP